MAEEKKDKKEAEKADKGKELSPEDDAAKSKKKRFLILIIAGVGLLLGIGAALFFFLSKGSDSANPSEAGEHATKPAESEHNEKSNESKHGKESAEKTDHGKSEKDKKEAPKEEKGEAKKNEHSDEHSKENEGEHKEANGKKDDKKGSDKIIDGAEFCTFRLQPFHLNLGNPLENRYVRIEVNLEHACNEELKKQLEWRTPQLRDAIIAVTSRKTREFLLGPDGKEQLRKEILNRVNHYMTKKVDDVFITDILIE